MVAQNSLEIYSFVLQSIPRLGIQQLIKQKVFQRSPLVVRISRFTWFILVVYFPQM